MGLAVSDVAFLKLACRLLCGDVLGFLRAFCAASGGKLNPQRLNTVRTIVLIGAGLSWQFATFGLQYCSVPSAGFALAYLLCRQRFGSWADSNIAAHRGHLLFALVVIQADTGFDIG
jgi:hypothetical protein